MPRLSLLIFLFACVAHAEDAWSRLRIGEVEFLQAGGCPRCIVTTIDQSTGQRGKEPLRTLARYRRNGAGDVLFGQHLIPARVGRLKIGDAVEILCSD